MSLNIGYFRNDVVNAKLTSIFYKTDVSIPLTSFFLNWCCQSYVSNTQSYVNLCHPKPSNPRSSHCHLSCRHRRHCGHLQVPSNPHCRSRASTVANSTMSATPPAALSVTALCVAGTLSLLASQAWIQSQSFKCW